MKKNVLLFLLTSALSWSCSKEAPAPEDENELITTVQLTFLEGTNAQTFEWEDTDGDGGKAPTIQNITLKANKSYKLSIKLLDESKMPATEITEEVGEESDEHLIVYTPTPSNLLSYSYDDKDKNGLPIGILGTIKTNNVGAGTLKVQLRHQPPVNGKNTKDGTSAPGSDDVNVDFIVTVN